MMVARVTQDGRSLAEVHSSVTTAYPSIWKRMFAFLGPAYLVSVGYMDPGNWATDLEGGARFGYQLLWVLVMSNAMAILLQTLAARLGIVNGRDLAQACREAYPRPINLALWVLCEIAIGACDLAEVLGAAIALNLLFGLPLLPGVLLMLADTLLILWLTRFGIRVIESVILSLIFVMGGCFLIEILLAHPQYGTLATGLVPRVNDQNLYIAIGILGATVMPHNLYLHSSLVQTRAIGSTPEDHKAACRFNLIDSTVAMNGALFINAAILILSATVFFTKGIVVTEIQQAHQLLVPLLGTSLAGIAFAIALLCSGQASTITGTMAGQIVMEGFLRIRMRPWLRRLITRTLAVIPAAITVAIAGSAGTLKLLILSQVVLSLQLPFAVIPLIHFTSDRARMGSFANRIWLQLLSWVTAALIVYLNIRLAVISFFDWTQTVGNWLWWVLAPLSLGLSGLLAWVTVEPWTKPRRLAGAAMPAPMVESPPLYRVILVPLDHSELDRHALAHASALAGVHKAKLVLVHVEEGVTSRVYGPLSSTTEVEAGRTYFEKLLESLRAKGLEADLKVVHGTTPATGIVRTAREQHADLLVFGAHGHKVLKDIVFGATINEVRHALDVPILVVRAPGPAMAGSSETH